MRILKAVLVQLFNVEKQEIILRFTARPVCNESVRKIILTFQHYQTLSQIIFFERAPGTEVPGEKKCFVSAVPVSKAFINLCNTRKNKHA